MPNILIADDEKDIIKLLRLYLEKEEVRIFEAWDGEAAFEILKKNEIDLALVDIMMPKINGYELIKRIRRIREIPIIVLSAKIQTSEKILGLDLGADDYITKPFDPLEVAARVRVQLRRGEKVDASIVQQRIKVGHLELDIEACTIKKGEEISDLTKTELLLAQLFMGNPGRVFTKEQIYEAGWQEAYVVDDNTIRVTINKLRDKLGRETITTIRGLGYRMERL